MKPTSRQYSCIWIAIKALKWSDDAKEELVISYTKDAKKTSLTDLTFEQAEDMKNFLNGLLNPSTEQPTTNKDADRIACDKIRKRIIATCHNLGWYITDADGQLTLKDGKKQIDYTRINQYCLEHTAAHRAFNSLTKEQLQAAAYQFDRMLVNYLKPSKPKQ